MSPYRLLLPYWHDADAAAASIGAVQLQGR
jgi:hypothetical protein